MTTSSYRELGLLAEGGMALIARAVREPDGLPVVIKRVRPPLCFDASYLRLFADEATLHAALENDNVVRLLDSGEDEQGPFLVFEHVDGTDLGVLLDRAIADGVPLDVELVFAIAIPLFSALCFVHECCRDGACLDVVHRDVSPGNILLGEDGSVKLADFGVAASRLKTEQTVAGELKGKFAYMAPEQTRGEKATPQADLFAAGVILWECLQNRRLWDAPTDADIVQRVRDEPAPPVDVERAGAGLAELVAALLAKDPAERPPSARAVRDRLRTLALERGLDEGLARIVARAVRTAPKRSLTALAPDVRRRTQRVLLRTPPPRRLRHVALPVALVVVIGAALGLAAVLGRPPPEIVTTLPEPSALLLPGPTSSAPTAPAPMPPSTIAAPAPTIAAPRPATNAAHPPPTTAAPARPARSQRPATQPAAETAKAEGFGRLSLTSEPWARVSVDGVVVTAETPLMGFPLPAGRHTVLLENPVLGLSKTLSIDIVADQHERRFVDLTR